jgi:hypothetical protein
MISIAVFMVGQRDTPLLHCIHSQTRTKFERQWTSMPSVETDDLE